MLKAKLFQFRSRVGLLLAAVLILAGCNRGEARAAMCAQATVLPPGQAVTGEVQRGGEGFMGIGGNTGAFRADCGYTQTPENVYSFTVDQTSEYELQVERVGGGEVTIHVKSACEVSEDIQCDTNNLQGLLEPGTYLAIVEGDTTAVSYSLKLNLRPVQVQGDACQVRRVLTPGVEEHLSSDMSRNGNHAELSCASQGAPDATYSLNVATFSKVTVGFVNRRVALRGAIGILRGCGAEAVEQACRASTSYMESNSGNVEAYLEPGDYTIVLETSPAGNLRANSSRDYGTLSVDVRDLEERRSVLQAPVLRSGQTVRGRTQEGQADMFRSSCASSQGAPDATYRLVIEQRSRVDLVLTTRNHDAVLALVSDIEGYESLECNDDDGDVYRSRVTRTLQPGTYYVVVDGYQPNAVGNFSLAYTATPVQAD